MPKPVQIFKTVTNGDPHEEHANKIRETFICEDDSARAGSQTCTQRIGRLQS